MKKNVMMRIASVLLICVLVTTCGISGTFAKYVSSDSADDSARVAKWGVKITTNGDGNAFAQAYENDEANAAGTEVEADVKVIAPGTKGTLLNVEVSGAPEVMVNVTRTATLTLDNWVVKSADYCPLVFVVTINSVKTTYQIDPADEDMDSIAELVAAINTALSADLDNQPVGTDLTYNATVAWEWPFNDNTTNNPKDTVLGDLAADADENNDPKITFAYDISIEQVD